MLEKLKKSVKKKGLEHQKHKFEKQAEKEHLRQEQIRAEQNRAEQEIRKIEEEKERLLALDEKSLQVEMILAIRGFFQRFTELEALEAKLSERMDSVESSILNIEFDISSLESEIENISSRIE